MFQNCPDRYFCKNAGSEQRVVRNFETYGYFYNKYPIKEADHSSRTQKRFFIKIFRIWMCLKKRSALEGIKYVITEILHRKKMSCLSEQFRK